METDSSVMIGEADQSQTDSVNSRAYSPSNPESHQQDSALATALEDETGGDDDNLRRSQFERPPAQYNVHLSEFIRLADAPSDAGDLCEKQPTIDDEADESDAYSGVDSEMIREAIEAAIEDAIAMKRSDSFLSTESNDDDETSNYPDEEDTDGDSQSMMYEGIPTALPTKKSKSASIKYMEEASFETTILSTGTHEVIQHGGVCSEEEDCDSSRRGSSSRRSSTVSEGNGIESWNFDNLSGFSPARISERYDFNQASKIFNDALPILESIVSEDDTDDHRADDQETQTDGSLVELLKSCQIELPQISGSSSRPSEVYLLHGVFKDFCRPALSLEAVESIYQNELKGTNAPVELPRDVVIERPNPSLARLFGTPLLSLPREWAMSLFRILLRILTNESDAEYDLAILKTCPWYEETFGEVTTIPVDEMPSRRRTESISSLKSPRSFSETMIGGNGAETARSNRMYSIVRLRASWKSILDQLLGVMDKILTDSEHLRGPATRLLGVLCSSGVTVKQLRYILDLATRQKTSAMAQLLLIRALRCAAAGSSRSLLGKADPRSFFSFTFGSGLTRTINLEKSSWPFKNDFGMAVWFRAEWFKGTSTLLRISNDVGDGIKLSVEPLDEAALGSAAVSVLTISIMEGGEAVQSIKVGQGILHERVWYHVAVRHTRSRLKGVFSMGSREQLVLMLDGKIMVTDSVRFPVVKDSKSMIVAFGEQFDGQTGGVYIFNNNVSDATLRALYERTSSTFTGSFPRRAFGEWNSHQGEIAKKSKVLDLEMRHDDVEDVVLSNRYDKDRNRDFVHVADVDGDDAGLEAGPLSRAAFSSRLYIVWDPVRIVGQVVLDLHSGAHVRMDPNCVQVWKMDSPQDVLGSVGGVQAVLPIFHSLLAPNVLGKQMHSLLENADEVLPRCLLCSAVPDALLLLSSLVRDHNENAREMMRCGAVDMVEQLLWANKLSPTSNSVDGGVEFSMFSAISIFPSLSRTFVDAVLELQATCSHYIGLETKVFTKLIFNLPLWLGESPVGVSIFADLLPFLSSTTMHFPQKVRDCVGVGGIVKVIIDLVETEALDDAPRESAGFFERNTCDFRSLCARPTTDERWHVCEVLFGLVFNVFFVGSTVDELNLLLGALSKFCETEWETASEEVGGGKRVSRSGRRELRHRFALRVSTLILILLESPHKPFDFLSNLAHACGGVQACAAWMLSAMVNSYCDRIRAIGVRCIVAYLRATGSHPDAPLALDDRSSMEISHVKSSEGRTLQENTLTLITNVGHGLLNSNVGKGLASIGPVMRSNSQAVPKLTPRVAYKLLWHLLKSHRYRIEGWTQASLVGIVFDQRSLTLAVESQALRENLSTNDPVFDRATTLNWIWLSNILQDTTVSFDAPMKGELGVNTIIRLLRFLPQDCMEKWLVDLERQASRTQSVVDMLSSTADWQACLFQLTSELLENLVCGTRKAMDETGPKAAGEETPNDAETLVRRLDLALDLYALLLANLFRHGGEKALLAMEDFSSLQRVCVNGQQVLIMILSKLFENLAESGVLPLEKVAIHAAVHDKEQSRVLLKRSARFVTDTILSNSSKGMTMPEAVDCWRSLRHLTAISVAMINRLGFGASISFDTAFFQVGAKDSVSRGSLGIRLSDDELKAADARTVVSFFNECNVGSEASLSGLEKAIDHRVCVNLAAQVLALLDVFIFPDSLDATLPVSQLHGLALVRSTESRVGGGQGPLLASLVRLSLVLLNQLETCSVSLLQCSSRLRCFLHWIFEMIRESEALDGYSATFNRLTAPFDRLVLSVVVQCRQILSRAHALQADLEAQSPGLDLSGREPRKKMYRRLLRVSLEMREILVTILEQRVDLLRASLSESSFEALKQALEGNENGEGSKDVLVHKLLCSGWVIGFQGMSNQGNVTVPNIFNTDDRSKATHEFRELQREVQDMSASFEKSLNACFDRYLEAQRKWAETGAVRDLEYEGDTTLKRLSSGYIASLDDLSKGVASRRQAADGRWRSIQRKVSYIWTDHEHWRLSHHADALGRRVVLVPNGSFDDHVEASYELLMGREREREERERQERLKRKEELSELMKRNSEAFVPIADTVGFDDDDDRDNEMKDGMDDAEIIEEQDIPSTTIDDSDFDRELIAEPNAKPDPKQPENEDLDRWARAFIWSESESVVARFDNIILVTLQSLIEGRLLLTTHGLYFHQTGDQINTVTKETFGSDRGDSGGDTDRRWRLSRLTEVHGRRYLLRPQALELFFSDWCELFINFSNGQKDRNRFYAKLRNSCRVPMLFSAKTLNPRTIFKKSNIAELWRKRRISNFDYIIALNRMAGRTFNDIAQYPVFPWILADYASEKIDLSDSRMYRDLSKPVGALNPDRLSQLLERYKELEQFGFSENERFLYGSHYSSPGMILHFLIRQEPFTSMAIDLQSGRFDCPDRLFFDIAESWLSCNTSSSDVKELIPEFFTLPEMFLNTNKFPLGKTQRGQKVDDVLLPPWAKGSAHEFVRMHRLALESEHVSRNLHHWIDLIFGFKQRGPEAEASHNIFHHLSYEGAVDLDKITDEVDRQATESHIQNFGQTPSQLLSKESHPSRLSAEECWYPLINNMLSTVRLRCHTPGKQFGGKNSGCGSAIKVGVQSDLITVIYADFKVGTFKWYPKATKNRLKPDKLRPLPNRFGSYSRAVIKRGSAAPQAMDDTVNELSVGNWSVAVTLGGYEKEQTRRRALMPSRLASAKDALYTDSASLIVSCGYWDNTIKVHSTDAWKLECMETGGHRGSIRCLSVDEDGGFMVSGGQDCTCRVWVIDHPDLAVSLADGYIQTALGHSTDGEQILSCCHVLWGHESPISCVDISSDLNVAASGSLDGKICVHSLRRGEFIRSFRPATKSTSAQVPVNKMALDKHGRLVIYMGDESLQTYTINGVCLCAVDAHEVIHDMKITGEVLITGGDRCHVYIRDLVTLKILSGLDLSRHGPIRSISLTPEDLNPTPQHLFIGSDDGMISIVDREDMKAFTGGR